jgi:hypothetical protein
MRVRIVRQAAGSLVLGAKRIGSSIVRHDATLSLNAPPKALADVSGVLLSNRASCQSNDSKKTEKKSHASHAKHNRKTDLQWQLSFLLRNY